jgi:hypothetical protein
LDGFPSNPFLYTWGLVIGQCWCFSQVFLSYFTLKLCFVVHNIIDIYPTHRIDENKIGILMRILWKKSKCPITKPKVYIFKKRHMFLTRVSIITDFGNRSVMLTITDLPIGKSVICKFKKYQDMLWFFVGIFSDIHIFNKSFFKFTFKKSSINK